MSFQRPAGVVRWVARVSAVCSLGLILAFLIGEPPVASHVTPSQWVALAFFPAGVGAGMVFGWWREGMGGAITIASLAIFYAIRFVTTGMVPTGWAFPALAAPGVLFLLSWGLGRK